MACLGMWLAGLDCPLLWRHGSEGDGGEVGIPIMIRPWDELDDLTHMSGHTKG